jgi:hypothetical protein
MARSSATQPERRRPPVRRRSQRAARSRRPGTAAPSEGTATARPTPGGRRAHHVKAATRGPTNRPLRTATGSPPRRRERTARTTPPHRITMPSRRMGRRPTPPVRPLRRLSLYVRPRRTRAALANRTMGTRDPAGRAASRDVDRARPTPRTSATCRPRGRTGPARGSCTSRTTFVRTAAWRGLARCRLAHRRQVCVWSTSASRSRSPTARICDVSCAGARERRRAPAGGTRAAPLGRRRTHRSGA